MDFELSTEQRELARGVAQFAEAELNDDMIRRDREAEFSRSAWRACADLGLQGLPIPAEHGGQGQDLLTTILVMEALGRACVDNGLVFSLNAQLWSVQMPLLAYGTPEQRDRYLPGLCDGSRIGAHGMSEPDSGSDAMAMRTRAVRDGDGYRLNGRKTFATNGPEADFAVVFATVRPEMKALGVTAFLVDRSTPGVTFSP
ncbi:MAG: acyl-CoA dehydrogenase family protein [Candidatus Eisenbacteria bacterium]